MNDHGLGVAMIENLRVINQIYTIVMNCENISLTLMKNVSWLIFDSFIKIKKSNEFFPLKFSELICEILLFFSTSCDRDLQRDSIFALDQLLLKTKGNVLREKIINDDLISRIVSTKFDQARELLTPSIKLIGQLLAGENHIVDVNFMLKL